jgi:hypothetical protein
MNQHPALLAIAIGLVGPLISMDAQAANPLGVYIGAGGGSADLRDEYPRNYLPCDATNCHNATVTGWTAFAGLQPLPFVGAELQYLDFGHTTQGVAGYDPYSKETRALALFGTGTLPLPLVDLYAKAGVGRLQTKSSVYYSDPNACLDYGGSFCDLRGTRTDRTDARFGWAVGAQLKLSSLAIRGEYLRFSAPDGDPSLLSLALIWKF